MLHSEDADINQVIRQVIDLDKKAVRIKKNVMDRAEKILDQTKNEIKDKEKKDLEVVQEIAKNNYNSEMKKAEESRFSIIKEAEQEIEKMRCRYDEKKDEKAMEILNKLFKGV